MEDATVEQMLNKCYLPRIYKLIQLKK